MNPNNPVRQSIVFEGPGEGRFFHGDTLRITGLTADTLKTWHKRKLLQLHDIDEEVPERYPAGVAKEWKSPIGGGRHSMVARWQESPGTGNHRLYSSRAILDLVAMKALAEVGVPLAEAGELARVIGKEELRYLRQRDDEDHYSLPVAIFRNDELKLFSKQPNCLHLRSTAHFTAVLCSGTEPVHVWEFLASIGRGSAILIDPGMLAERVLDGICELLGPFTQI
ncbi:MAG TPA: hypothetical protein VG096_20460 [Bryobacteraceae bacterium]|jgi:DNA-binding transcriptional MerR regulator|nr:hypothetical protein [Bryobacteraceae bacterium]